MLTVYKASAGSGKTFRLVLEYLKLMLTRKNYYRHILAVTFTNKATAEMKERIVEQLGNMSANRETPYLEILAKETGLAETVLRLRASEALKSLLFDFNRFSVSTIDKFTQQVLKSFNREIGVNPYYQLETDTDMLISEAVDRLMAGIANNKSLREWLESYIAEKIRNNRSFEFEREIRDLGKELFKEKLQGKFSLLSDFSSDRVKAAEYLKMMEQIIFSFEANWKRRATDIVKAYKTAGYTSDDFAGKGRGIGAYLEKAVSGEVDVLKNYVTKAAESPEGWLTKMTIKNTALLQLVSGQLWPLLQEMVALHTDNWRKYCTAKAISREWYTASILVDLNNEVAALSREKGVLPLAGSNLLLKAVIDGNDAPFIYEKVGNRYFSFMLDEFQDTSEMQWENFRPLVTNSMASGYANLVVGDIKQSIYRWRNSSWNLLEEQIFKDFRKEQINDEPLTINHRSAREIIHFNNNLFSELLVNMVSAEKLKPYAEQFTSRLQNIYRDLAQKSSPRSADKGGFVCVEKLDSDDENFGELSLNRLAAQVRTLYNNGFNASDIVILVRGKREGVRIVDHFLKIAGEPENLPYNFQIISGESLFLVSSPAVNFIVQLFRYLEDRENLLTQTVLLHLHRNYIRPSLLESDGDKPEREIDASAFENTGLFEAELEPVIAALGQQMSTGSLDEAIIRICSAFRLFDIPSELPYLQSLIDQVADLKKKMISDIPGFLEWWDETGFEVSVNVNETTDAIRLMTIHKAKGLEFRAVLIPFFNWRTTGNGRKNIIWCEPDEAPFNAAPLVPVNFSDQLAETIFSEDWLQESFNVIVDNLNLIYVAFTRAESVLWVNLPAKGKPAGIESYLAKALESLSQHPGFEQKEEEGLQRFIYGTLPVINKKNVGKEAPTAIRWHFREFSGRLKLKVTEEDFLAKGENGLTRKNLGIVLHDLLSGISKATDIEPAVKRAEAAGMIPQSAAKEVLDHLLRMAEHPVAKDWFSGSWKVLNEADLLTPEDTWRPDRIMISGNSAVLVDFKTGLQKRESHSRQVRNYAHLLCESGFNPVTGYLWYMNSDEPELVVTHC